VNYSALTTEELFALCVWREASGEGYAGMLGVAWNIWNRHLRWRQSLRTIILTPNQFTSMTVEKNPRNPEPNDREMVMARTIVSQVMAGAVQDPTNGSCYYANLDSVRAANVAAGRPSDSGWFFAHIVQDPKNHPLTAEIGQHTYYA